MPPLSRPFLRRTRTAFCMSLYTVHRVRCFVTSRRPSKIQILPACLSSRICNSRGIKMRWCLPVFESTTYGRFVLSMSAVFSDRASLMRRPVSKQTSIASAFAGIMVASMISQRSSQTQLLRDILASVPFPDNVYSQNSKVYSIHQFYAKTERCASRLRKGETVKGTFYRTSKVLYCKYHVREGHTWAPLGAVGAATGRPFFISKIQPLVVAGGWGSAPDRQRRGVHFGALLP